MRPIVGITSYVESARWGVWDGVAALVPFAYVRMVSDAGGRAVVLPPDGAGIKVIDILDALVLAGGPDIDPGRYGAPAHPRTRSGTDRDGGETALVGAALRANLPILGVCRGMQLLAVAYGGSLHQHVPDLVGHEKHRPGPGVYGSHPVRFAPGSRLAKIMGDEAEVNSHHHQAVADTAALAATGWADDGVIEAVEDPERRFVVGVQWHPEESSDLRPFAALIRAAVRRARPAPSRGTAGPTRLTERAGTASERDINR